MARQSVDDSWGGECDLMAMYVVWVSEGRELRTMEMTVFHRGCLTQQPPLVRATGESHVRAWKPKNVQWRGWEYRVFADEEMGFRQSQRKSLGGKGGQKLNQVWGWEFREDITPWKGFLLGHISICQGSQGWQVWQLHGCNRINGAGLSGFSFVLGMWHLRVLGLRVIWV